MVRLTLPTGAKDLLPLDVAQKHWIESRLQSVFQTWGYQRIITPTLERLETLTAGGAVLPESVIQMNGSGVDVLGLRPELTASIARAYAARLGRDAASCPQRLYYNGNVFRQLAASGYPSQQEYYQSGVELLGGKGLVADGEILLLLADCLQQVELPNWQMILGDAKLTSALLNTFPEQHRQKIRHCLAHLDRVALENLLIPDEVRSRALDLLDLRGTPQEVLARVMDLPWISDFRGEIDYLKSLIALWESAVASPNLEGRLILDLSLMQTFNYYTGIVFEVVSANYVVAQGGRYDQLLGVYHPQGITYPSIGFCLNLEDLQKVLLANLPTESQTSSCLIVPTQQSAIAQSFAYAAELRRSLEINKLASSQNVVEIELEWREPEAVRNHARSRGIKQIAWVGSSSEITVEQVSF